VEIYFFRKWSGDLMRNTDGGHDFQRRDVMGASPIRLVLMAYDLAISACEQEDFNRATKTLSILRDSLGYDYGKVTVGLFSLYQWCLDCIRKEDYQSALIILQELRDAWAKAENKINTITQNKLDQRFIPPSKDHADS
jgi:flagellin-specific chaperone FliS